MLTLFFIPDNMVLPLIAMSGIIDKRHKVPTHPNCTKNVKIIHKAKRLAIRRKASRVVFQSRVIIKLSKYHLLAVNTVFAIIFFKEKTSII